MPDAVVTTNPGQIAYRDGESRSLSVDGTGRLRTAGGEPQAYTLLNAASVTGPAVSGIRGGDYMWRVSGTFAGATVTLQTLDLDGTTWINVRNAANTADVTATVASTIGVGIGQGATVRALISGATGAPSLNSTLSGLS